MKVLITGASRGIGRAIADLLKSKGHIVITPGRSELDLSSMESIQKYIKVLENDYDILINNAGINKIAKLPDVDDENISTTFQINFTAPLLLSKHLITTSFLPRKFGRILNIGTVWLKSPRTGRTTYTASKAALESFTKSLALEFGDDNILTNMISPGIVGTELTTQNNSPEAIFDLVKNTSIKRLIGVDEIAKMAEVLVIGNDCINGQNFFIDGGFKGSF